MAEPIPVPHEFLDALMDAFRQRDLHYKEALYWKHEAEKAKQELAECQSRWHSGRTRLSRYRDSELTEELRQRLEGLRNAADSIESGYYVDSDDD